ncbi:MAG: hypothetical protein WDN04_19130 [Rhodospirillales bacterium]
MPLLHALYLGLATLAVALATMRGRIHTFLAVLLAAVFFALASSMSISQLGKIFGTGFGQALNMLGLPVLAAAMVSQIGDSTPATAHLTTFTAAWSNRARTAVLALLGLVGGTGASTAAAFAVLGPLRAALAGAGPRARRRGGLALGLGASAGQAFLLPSPVLIAAAAIIGAEWSRVLAIGLPVGLLTAAAGALMATLVSPVGTISQAPHTRAPPANGTRLLRWSRRASSWR